MTAPDPPAAAAAAVGPSRLSGAPERAAGQPPPAKDARRRDTHAPSATRPGTWARLDWQVLPAVALPLAVYLATLAPSITWRHGGGDSGELAAAVAAGAVPHPPGYPLYLLLGRLAYVTVPLAEPAARLNLLSALCVALAGGLVALAARPLLEHLGTAPGTARLAALAAALSFALAPLPWSQAILTEVYGLALLLECAVLLALVRWDLAPAPRLRTLCLAALLAGLGLLAHAMLVWTLVGGLVLLALRRDRLPRDGRLLLVPLAFALGLLPLLALPVAATLQPTYSWGRVATPAGLLYHVTAADYRSYVLALAPAEVAARVPVEIRTLAAQFSWAGWAVALLGAGWLRERRPHLLALTLPAAMGGALFVLGYGADHPETYLLVVLPGAALWLAAGLAWLAEQPRSARYARWIPAAALALPLGLAAFNYGTLDLRADTAARDYALRALAAAPPGAALVTRSDQQTFSLAYAQRALGLRPDVLVLDQRLLFQAWYPEALARRRPGLVPAASLAALQRANPGMRFAPAPALDPADRQ